jgi:hypothetical protein
VIAIVQKGRRGRRLKRRRSTVPDLLGAAWHTSGREILPLSPITARCLPCRVIARIAELERWPAEIRAAYGLAKEVVGA